MASQEKDTGSKGREQHMPDKRRKQLAGWSDTELLQRKQMIGSAIAKVFPAKKSYRVGKNDEQKKDELKAETRKVAAEFTRLGSNDWYVPLHKDSHLGGLGGLETGCFYWAWGVVGIKGNGDRNTGWWATDGVWKRGNTVTAPGNLNNLSRQARKRSSNLNSDERDDSRAGSTEREQPSSTLNGAQPNRDGPTQRIATGTEFDPFIISSPNKQIKREQTPPTQIETSLRPRNSVYKPAILSDINRKEIVIEVDGPGPTTDIRYILVRELMPKQVVIPRWYDFDHQPFLNEFKTVYTDVLLGLGGINAYSLTYTNEPTGRRLEILKNGTMNKNNYPVMLKDFSTSRLPDEDTIKLRFELASQTSTSMGVRSADTRIAERLSTNTVDDSQKVNNSGQLNGRRKALHLRTEQQSDAQTAAAGIPEEPLTHPDSLATKKRSLIDDSLSYIDNLRLSMSSNSLLTHRPRNISPPHKRPRTTKQSAAPEHVLADAENNEVLGRVPKPRLKANARALDRKQPNRAAKLAHTIERENCEAEE